MLAAGARARARARARAVRSRRMASLSQDDAPPPARGPGSGWRWVRALLGTAAYLVWTLVPFDLRAPDFETLFEVAVTDLAGNVLMVIPLGWLWADVVGRRRAAGLLAVSAVVVEAAQLFVATRSPALSDVVANGLGGFIGAVWWAGSRERPLVNVMVTLLALWSVAHRYGAPSRPALSAALLAALGVATLRVLRPSRGTEATAFALIGVGGIIALSPPLLVAASLLGLAGGALFPAPLVRFGRAAALVGIGAFVIERYPWVQVAPGREGDGLLLVVETALIVVALAHWALYAPQPSGPSAPSHSPAAPGSPAPSTG